MTFLSQAFVHARWTGMWHRRIGTDVFGQYQYNEFLRLLVRGVGGGGARVEAVHHPRFLFWGGAGYLFEYNRVRVAPGATDPPETYEHRLTTYMTGRLSLWRDQLLLQNTLYWQPRLDAFGDVRVLEECEAQVRISELLSLGVTVSVLYDSAPPTAVQTTDLRLFTALKIEI
mgnify:CR=1 FL=1